MMTGPVRLPAATRSSPSRPLARCPQRWPHPERPLLPPRPLRAPCPHPGDPRMECIMLISRNRVLFFLSSVKVVFDRFLFLFSLSLSWSSFPVVFFIILCCRCYREHSFLHSSKLIEIHWSSSLSYVLSSECQREIIKHGGDDEFIVNDHI